MPDCLVCGIHFPARLVVNDRIINGQRRKYCLDCSPYGQHNTKKLESLPNKIGIECQKCHKNYSYKKSQGHTLSLCNSCAVNKRKRGLKSWATDYLGGKCTVCGYDRCVQAMDFHHVDPSTKRFGIGGNLSSSKAKLTAELNKCILLCSNCHREFHEGMLKLENFSRSGTVVAQLHGKE